MKSFNYNEITSKIQNLLTKDKNTAIYEWSTDSTLSKLFAPNLPVTTLIHEILHAIVHSSHIDSSHDNPRFFKDLSFDDTAIAIYQLVLRKGIVDKYLLKLKSI